jgi:hypothetical protein
VQPSWLSFSTTPNQLAVIIEGDDIVVADFGHWNGATVWLPLITLH